MNAILQNMILLQAAAPAAGTENSSGQMISTIVTFALIFVVFYFLIIRPQNKKQKEMQKMVADMKKGDKVVTIGGIHGVIQSVKEQTVIVKVDDNVRMEFSKSAISTVSPKAAEEKAESEKSENAEAVAEDDGKADAAKKDAPAPKAEDTKKK